MEKLLNKKNVFTNYRHPINKNTKSYIFSSNNKLYNPFLKQSIFPPSSTHYESLHMRPKSCSNRFMTQLKNGESGTGYHNSFKECKSQSVLKYDRKKFVTSQHVHEQFIKSRNKQIQRKCLLVFGPEALRYTPNNQQQNNQYFDKNDKNNNNIKQQRHSKVNKIFRQSTNIYSQNQNQQQKIRAKTKNNHKKSKKSININQNKQQQSSSNSRFKVKKILSWNVQNQNAQNLPPGSETSSQNITSANQKNFRHPTFGVIDKSTKNTQVKAFKCQKQSSLALKFDQKPNQDYILQSSDGFKIQENQSSPPNSLPNVQQQLFQQKSNVQKRNNLQYSSYFDSDGTDMKSSFNFFRLIDLKKCSRMSYNSEDSKIEVRYKLNYDIQNNKSRIRFNFPNQIKYEGVKFELLSCII